MTTVGCPQEVHSIDCRLNPLSHQIKDLAVTTKLIIGYSPRLRRVLGNLLLSLILPLPRHSGPQISPKKGRDQRRKDHIYLNLNAAHGKLEASTASRSNRPKVDEAGTWARPPTDLVNLLACLDLGTLCEGLVLHMHFWIAFSMT